MYARMFTLQVKMPDMVNTVHKIVQDALLPASKQFTGLTDVFQLADRQTGKIVSISFWETEANAQALTDGSFINEVLAQMMEFLSTTPTDEIYEMLM